VIGHGTVTDPTNEDCEIRGIVVENKRLPVVPVKEPVPAFTDNVTCATTSGSWRETAPEALPLSVPAAVVMVKEPMYGDGVVDEGKASTQPAIWSDTFPAAALPG
jgi:hypothetical protein